MPEYLLDTNHVTHLLASRTRGLVLLSADRHFQFVDDLAVENWLVDGKETD